MTTTDVRAYLRNPLPSFVPFFAPFFIPSSLRSFVRSFPRSSLRSSLLSSVPSCFRSFVASFVPSFCSGFPPRSELRRIGGSSRVHLGFNAAGCRRLRAVSGVVFGPLGAAAVRPTRGQRTVHDCLHPVARGEGEEASLLCARVGCCQV